MNKTSDIKKSDNTIKHQNKNHPLHRNQELYNPCLKEHYSSLKCLDDNDYVHNKCKLHFVNYKNCRKFWNEVMAIRKQKDITPALPPPEERSKIKAEFLSRK